MANGSGPQRRLLTPEDLSDWPKPDPSSLIVTASEIYRRRCSAVEMYASGITSQSIEKETGITAREVRRIISRCLTGNGLGTIAGFFACLPSHRIKKYSRSMRISCHIGEKQNGAAGALSQIFARFPEVEQMIQAKFLNRKTRGSVNEARISIADLHKAFKKKLRELGVSEYDWPFSTKNMGLESLRRYCKWMETSFSDEYFSAREHSKGAHTRTIGTGQLKMFRPLRPYVYKELDYNKVDAASIIGITNSFGVQVDIDVPRWYFGLMAEGHSHLITGVYVGFEVEPSSDALLETVQSAVFPAIYADTDPRASAIVDARIMPSTVMRALQFQTFAVLKLDNAWANAGTDAINSIMDLTGCAINFGPPGAWSRRSLVERIFNALGSKGLKRSPSTYGASPSDPARKEPEENARKCRILASDIVSLIIGVIREYNTTVSEGQEFGSPEESINAALSTPDSGFFPQPLAKQAQRERRFEYCAVKIKVLGYPKRGVKPYVKPDRCRYTNTRLSERSDLIGRYLLLYIRRQDVSDAFAVVMETGENLGPMNPESKWAQRISIRFRKYLNTWGRHRAMKRNDGDVFTEWLDTTTGSLFDGGKPIQKKIKKRVLTKKVSKKDTLYLTKLHSSGAIPDMLAPQTLDGNTKNVLQRKKKALAATEQPSIAGETPDNPFGLSSRPNLTLIRRK
jgi:putative transposase